MTATKKNVDPTAKAAGILRRTDVRFQFMIVERTDAWSTAI
jgi:hypothetical protein